MNNVTARAIVVLLLLSFIIVLSANAQSDKKVTVSGTVVNADGQPLEKASVSIPGLLLSTTTDDKGAFSFTDVTTGMYIIEVSLAGYQDYSKENQINDASSSLHITLQENNFVVPGVTVTAEPQPAGVFETGIPLSIVEGRALDRARGQSVMQSIENEPGVSEFSGGPLAMKPVVRGLTAQRVVVCENGTRIESQTWDEPQSPEINSFDASKIEIVRGPGSVLYGSDALGGVVNVLTNDVFAIQNGNALAGDLTVNAFSNNEQAGGSLNLFGQQQMSSGLLAYKVNATGRTAGDYTAPGGLTSAGDEFPGGKVFNSGADEFDASGDVGYRAQWGTLRFTYAHFGQKYYISPDPERKEIELNVTTMQYDTLPASPSQEIQHEKADLYANIPTSLALLEMNLDAQYNSRKEEGVKESDDVEQKKHDLGIPPEAQLDLKSFGFTLKAHHQPMGNIFGTIGLSTELQNNQTLGKNPIIPGYNLFNFGAFAFEELKAAENVHLAAGLRFDTRSLSVTKNDSLNLLADQDLNYNALTGSVNLAFQPLEELTISLNYGNGWRAPTASELYTYGADEGEARFKIGNASLTPERSNSYDLTLKVNTEQVYAEVSGYDNEFTNYIFLQPTGNQSDEGLDEYTYLQADAQIYGVEALVQYHVTHTLNLSVGYDKIGTENKLTQTPLPLIPANKLKTGIQYSSSSSMQISGNSLVLKNPYAFIGLNYTFTQDRPGSDEETVTPEYALVNLGIGADVYFGSTPVKLDFTVTNLLDRSYYDHLSRYKEYALNPGRDFALRASVPFSIIQ